MRTILKSAVALFVLAFSSVQAAVVVDFENYIADLPFTTIPSSFLSVPNYNDISPAVLTLQGETFGSGGITFSGGVLLESPTGDGGVLGDSILGDGGDVYYGTAFSPSTSITTSNYPTMGNLGFLEINIASTEGVQSVQGSLIQGLNIEDLVDYTVNYFFDDSTTAGFTESISALFTNGDEVVSFGLDTTLDGALSGELITKVTVIADELIVNMNTEFDFLLAAVEFSEGANPVPVPAALPLFISALLGGFVVARPKRTR